MKPIINYPSPPANAEESEEEDYMSMALPTPTTFTKKSESSIQRTQRLRREAEARGRIKPKAEREADEAAAREKALQTSLISNDDPDTLLSSEEIKKNKGLAMMAKMGFKIGAGTGLGKGGEGRTEPIGVEMKGDRGGIGMDSEKKRKFREEVEREGKRVKAEEGEYRERVMREREEARLEGLVVGAMKIVEQMDEEREGDTTEGRRTKPLKSINLLYRNLVRQRETKARENRMRHDLQQSLSRLPTYDDADEDADDKLALPTSASKNKSEAAALIMEEELEEEDPELEEWNALEAEERLERLVEYLRREYWYCFWCKSRYSDDEMEGCPGVSEEDHD